MTSLREIIETLDLKAHPEGGYFRETWRHDGTPRGAGTAIYYALDGGRWSTWHRCDADEMWHHYAGATLELEISLDGEWCEAHHLGLDLPRGERPQILVPRGAWQRARSLGDFTLVGCTVSPAFEFSGFELATDAGPAPRRRGAGD